MTPHNLSILSAALLALGGCGAHDAVTPQAATGAHRSTLQGQAIPAPCDWLPAADAEAALGKLLAAPRVGRSASDPNADPEGAACVYTIAAANGKPVDVAVQVDVLGSLGAERAATALDGMFARELNDGAQVATTKSDQAPGWDYAGGLPEMRVWRVGHVAVAIGAAAANFLVPEERLAALAVRLRNRVPDLPMAQPGASTEADTSPDPCALLSRADAESVLGALAAAPFRSTEGTPLADGEGASCTYYSPGHRALVLTPTRANGRALFGMVSGASDLIRRVTGGDEGTPRAGPWDRAAEGSTGSLYFLAGDRMLEIAWRTSGTDARGATRIATLAVPKLVAQSSG